MGLCAPEDLPEESVNDRADPRLRCPKARVARSQDYATAMAVLSKPAELTNNALVGWGADFSSWFNQFPLALNEICKNGFILSDAAGNLYVYIAVVAQFGGNTTPSLGCGAANTIARATYEEFISTDASMSTALASKNHLFAKWLAAREHLGRSLAQEHIRELESHGLLDPLNDSSYQQECDRITLRHIRTQQQCFFLDVYVDDTSGLAAGNDRAFQSHVAFASVCLKLHANTSVPKLQYGTMLDNLGFTLHLRVLCLEPTERRRTRLITLISDIIQKPKTPVGTFRSLVCTLSAACVAYHGNRMSLRHLFRTLARTEKRQHRRNVIIDDHVRGQLIAWLNKLEDSSFLKCVISQPRRLPGGQSWSSDACRPSFKPGDRDTVAGAGGFLPLHDGYYWHTQFPDWWVPHLEIHHLEALGCYINLVVFGKFLRGYEIDDECDNSGVVDTFNLETASDPILCHIAMERITLAAEFGISTKANHHPGVLNVLADDLSRDRIDSFKANANDRGYSNPRRLEVPQEVFVWVEQMLSQQPTQSDSDSDYASESDSE